MDAAARDAAGAVLPAGGRFARTLPRQLVHRAAVSEVLTTGRLPGGDQRCAVDVQWPRDHSFFAPIGDRWHDPLLALETMRQASMVAAFLTFHESGLRRGADGRRAAGVRLHVRLF